MQIKFVVNGHTQLSRNLRILAREVPNLKLFMDEALDIMQARTHQLFASQGSAVEKAGAWPPLSKKTLRAREMRWGYYKRAPNRPGLLRWTGALEDTVTRQTSDSKGTLTHSARSDKGFNYPLAHQQGSGRLPQRVVIDISNPTIAEMQRALQGHVYRTIGMFGRQI